MAPNEDDVALYKRHYSDWTVHELPLMVSVPTAAWSRDEAIDLVRQILEDAAFDIRVHLIEPTT